METSKKSFKTFLPTFTELLKSRERAAQNSKLRQATVVIQRWWRARKSSKISQNEDGVSKKAKKKKLSDCNFVQCQAPHVVSRAGTSKNRSKSTFGFLFKKTPSKTSSIVSLDTMTTCRWVIELHTSFYSIFKKKKPISTSCRYKSALFV